MFRKFNIALKFSDTFSQKLFLSALLFIFSSPALAQNLPSKLTIEGRFFIDGSPVDDRVDVRFEIIGDGVAGQTCVLYREDHEDVNVSSSDPSAKGMFSLQLGAGSNILFPVAPTPMTTFFANHTSINGDGCIYNPIAGDSRYVKTSVRLAGVGSYTHLAPDTAVTSVPFSLIAESAESLRGLGPTDFFRNNGDAATKTANQTRLQDLLAISPNDISSVISGNNTNYVKANNTGAQIPHLSVNPSSGMTRGQMWYNTTDDKFYFYNGTVATELNTGDATKLPLSGGTMTGSIAMGANTDFNGYHLLETGHITMNPQSTITIGRYSLAQETALVATLDGSNAGAVWFNYETNKLMYWSGLQAFEVSDTTTAGGDITAVNTPNGSALSGGDTDGAVNLSVVVDNATIEISSNALRLKDGGVSTAKLADSSVTTIKLANDSVTTAKIQNSAVTDAKIADLSVDKITSGTNKYFLYQPNGLNCSTGAVLKKTANGWECGVDIDTNTQAVSSVYGRTGAVVATNGDYSAAQVTNAPSGNISGTTVQSAVNELDTEKVAKAGDTMTGHLSMANQREMRFVESGSTNYIALRAPTSLAADFTLTLPIDDGTNGQVLTTDGLGMLTWTSVTSGTVTSVATGSGLTGGTITNSGTISVATGGISSAHITDGTIATVDIANGAVTDAKIGTLSVNKISSAVGQYFSYAPNGGACLNGEILKKTTNGWDCGADENSGGDILAVTTSATSGLTGGGTSGSLALAVDSSTAATGVVQNSDVPNCTASQKLQMSAGPTYTWSCVTDVMVTDHGDLTGNTDDDHLQYALLAGRSGGQTLRGGIAAGNNLTLESTSHGTKGFVVLQPSSGNVGIGTTAPAAKLDVAGTIRAQQICSETGTNCRDLSSVWTSDGHSLDAADGSPVDALYVDNDGRVGIGTTGPSAALHIHNTAAALILRDSADLPGSSFVANIKFQGGNTGAGDAGYIGYSASNEMRFNTGSASAPIVFMPGGTEQMRVVPGGNVGIGTTNPEAKLHVQGSIVTGVQEHTSGTINWATGDTVRSSSNCSSAFNFSNLKAGGSYTLVVTNGGTTKCTFNDTGGGSFKFKPENDVRESGSHTIYTFIRISDTIYVTWATGFL